MKRSNTILRACVFTTASFIISHPAATAQTQMDLKSQAKGIDFSRATATKPFKTGTTLPSTCTVGEGFFKTDVVAGQNIYSCTAANTWTVQSGSGLPNLSGNADRVLTTNGTQASWNALGGDLSGSPQMLQVTGLRGNRVASTTPTDGQVLRWNSAASNWEPGVVSGGGSGSTATGGDLFGPIGNATVTRMQNKPLSAALPTDGQVLTWSQSAGQWQPQSPNSVNTGNNSSPSPSGSASLSVLSVMYNSGNTLTIGAGCSSDTPCNVRFGNNVISITTSFTATWQSGAGLAYIYVTSSGTVTIGSNLTVSCSTGCVAARGITQFPANSIPLYTWNAVLTGWESSGGHDARAYLSSKLLSPGTGVLMIESGQQTTIGVDTTLIPTYTIGSASLAFGTLAAQTCSGDLNVSVPGAAAGDSVAAAWPATLPASVIGMMRVTAADVVAVRLCNVGNAGASVAAGNYRATIVRGL